MFLNWGLTPACARKGNPTIYVYQHDSISDIISYYLIDLYSILDDVLNHCNSGGLAFRTVAWCGVCNTRKVLTKHTLGFRYVQ